MMFMVFCIRNFPQPSSQKRCLLGFHVEVEKTEQKGGKWKIIDREAINARFYRIASTFDIETERECTTIISNNIA